MPLQSDHRTIRLLCHWNEPDKYELYNDTLMSLVETAMLPNIE